MEEEMGPSGVHPETLKEKPPLFISNLYYNVTDIIASNGWYLVIFAAVCALIWPKLHSYYNKWQEDIERRREAAFHSKNPDVRHNRQLAMEIARQRMQLQHDRLAEEAAEEAKQKEELRRQERLARMDKKGGGYRLNDSTPKTTTTTATQRQASSNFRPDYNPLMGSGSSPAYHPTRRTCPGGGCG